LTQFKFKASEVAFLFYLALNQVKQHRGIEPLAFEFVSVDSRSFSCSHLCRIDNLIYRRAHPHVLAVLDWELSTLGDPLSDLAYCCLPYFLPPKFPIMPGETIAVYYLLRAATSDDDAPFLSWRCELINTLIVGLGEFFDAPISCFADFYKKICPKQN